MDSCVSPLSLSALSAMSPDSGGLRLDQSMPLSYGPTLGSRSLREAVLSALSMVAPPKPSLTSDDVLITPGTISANFLILDTLIKPGDHVICQYPNYGPLLTVPRRAGAHVDLWRCEESSNWIPEPEKLRSLIKNNTKLIVVTNPTNPAGAAILKPVMKQIVEIARQHDIILLVDEVFSPMFHGVSSKSHPDQYPPCTLSFGYEKTIVSGSLSKAYALPGVRVGWIVTSMKDAMQELIHARDYTTISVSQIDQQIATFALTEPVRGKILHRTEEICRQNIGLVEAFVEKHNDVCTWVKPTGGGTSFVRLLNRSGNPVDDKAFCEGLVRHTALLVVPGGYCFGTGAEGDYKGYLRIGIVGEPKTVERALGYLSTYLQSGAYEE